MGNFLTQSRSRAAKMEIPGAAKAREPKERCLPQLVSLTRYRTYWKIFMNSHLWSGSFCFLLFTGLRCSGPELLATKLVEMMVIDRSLKPHYILESASKLHRLTIDWQVREFNYILLSVVKVR